MENTRATTQVFPDKILMDALYHEQSELLIQINERRGGVGENKNKIVHLKRRYNDVVAELDSLVTSPFTDPLDGLPREIWEAILLESVYTEVSWDVSRIDTEKLLAFTLVSTKWRRTLLNTPRFWASIYIGPLIEEIEVKVYTQIILSHDLPLSIYFAEQVTDDLWRRVVPYINGQYHRIQYIHAYDLDTVLDILGTSFESLPLLDSLSSTITKVATLNPFIQKTTMIRNISGFYLSLDHLQLPQFRRIRRLETREPLHLLLPYLQRLEDLEHIQIHSSLSNEQECRPIENIGCRWRSLRLMQRAKPQTLESILRISGPTLVKLNIVITWVTLSTLFLHFSTMPLLRTLGFWVEPGSEELKLFPATLPELNVMELIVGIPMFQANATRHQHNIKILSSALVKCATQVQRLKIKSRTNEPALFQYVCSLKKLVFVDLSDAHISTEGDAILRTEQLSITGTGEIAGLDDTRILGSVNLYAPRYLRLSVLKSAQWQGLQSLDLSYIRGDWVGISLPAVKVIKLGVFSLYIYDDTIESSFMSLCAEIAVHLDAFPALERIESSRYPEWDILFLMLERRNFLPNKSATRISTLVFPVIPSLVIVQSLAELLRGRFSNRPSNYELSLDGLTLTYTDPKIPGCNVCLRGLRYCTKEIKSSWKTSSPTYLPTLVAYPRSLQGILSTRLARSKRWHVLIKNHPRASFCQWAGKSQPFEIKGIDTDDSAATALTASRQ